MGIDLVQRHTRYAITPLTGMDDVAEAACVLARLSAFQNGHSVS
jgi:hypothetical protein